MQSNAKHLNTRHPNPGDHNARTPRSQRATIVTVATFALLGGLLLLNAHPSAAHADPVAPPVTTTTNSVSFTAVGPVFSTDDHTRFTGTIEVRPGQTGADFTSWLLCNDDSTGNSRAYFPITLASATTSNETLTFDRDLPASEARHLCTLTVVPRDGNQLIAFRPTTFDIDPNRLAVIRVSGSSVTRNSNGF